MIKMHDLNVSLSFETRALKTELKQLIVIKLTNIITNERTSITYDNNNNLYLVLYLKL